MRDIVLIWYALFDSLLQNKLGVAAAAIVAAAKDLPQLKTLCGIPPEKADIDFSHKRLDSGDAQLIAFYLSKNGAIKTLKCNPPPAYAKSGRWPAAADQRQQPLTLVGQLNPPALFGSLNNNKLCERGARNKEI